MGSVVLGSQENCLVSQGAGASNLADLQLCGTPQSSRRGPREVGTPVVGETPTAGRPRYKRGLIRSGDHHGSPLIGGELTGLVNVAGHLGYSDLSRGCSWTTTSGPAEQQHVSSRVGDAHLDHPTRTPTVLVPSKSIPEM